MKYIAAIALTFSLLACTGKKNMVKSPEGVTEAQFQAAKTRFADVTMEQLKNGHSIYNGACTNCHGAKNIASRDEQAWTKIMDRMAPKANLTDAEKESVWRYIMGVKLLANS